MANTAVAPLDDGVADFLSVSSALIGVPAKQLTSVAGNNTPSYQKLAQSANPATYAKMIAVYQANPTVSPDDLATMLLADAAIQPLAQRVMVLWLLGSWNGVVVGFNAYTSGLAWSIAQTKPMGTINGPSPIGTFGYWNTAPTPASGGATAQ